MKYLYVLVFILVYVFGDMQLGYTNQSAVHTHFTYMFQHSGAVHLSLNSLAFVGMFRAMEKSVKGWFLSACVISVSFAASFACTYNIPTVGASSMIYTMIGMYLGITICNRSVKIADTGRYLPFMLAVAVSLAVSYFKPYSNFNLHLFCLVWGCILSLFNRRSLLP